MPKVPASSGMSPSFIRTPSKRMALSQNFLHNRRLVQSLVRQSGIGPDDLAIEIGPGRGIITDALAEAARHVLAIEKDPVHAAIVQRRLEAAGRENVTVFAADFLDFPLPATPYRIFANIPFAITAAIVGKLTTGTAPPASAHLVVQQEAAERFMGAPIVTLQAATLHPWFACSIDHRFQRRDFSPPPQVDCVLLRIERRPSPLLAPEERQRYEEMTSTLFSAWKPSVESALESIIGREEAKALRRPLGAQAFSLTNRPSRFPLDGWVTLYRELARTPNAPWWQAFHESAARLQQRQQVLEKRHRSISSGPRHR
ncbi:MAG: rRNA adenine dimethyltransferase family protein [Thermomicrobiales bacterium]